MKTPLLDGIKKEAWVGLGAGMGAAGGGILGGLVGAIADKENRGRGFLRGGAIGAGTGGLLGAGGGVKIQSLVKKNLPEVKKMMTTHPTLAGLDTTKIDPSTFSKLWKGMWKQRELLG